MNNYVHPKIFSPIILELFYGSDFDDSEASEVESKTIENMINGYRYRKGFSDKVKGCVYRIVQFIKSIFGKSDWNKAFKILSNFMYKDGSGFVENKNDLEQALSEERIKPKVYKKMMRTNRKMLETTVNFTMLDMIKYTKQKIQLPVDADLEEFKFAKEKLTEIYNANESDEEKNQELFEKFISKKLAQDVCKLSAVIRNINIKRRFETATNRNR